MSLLGRRTLLPLISLPATAGHGRLPVDADDGGAGDRVGYVVIYNPPDLPVPGHPRGWTLTAWPPRPREEPTRLAHHGAADHAGPRVAKAVAVRVLADRGVTVTGWADPTTTERHGGTMVRYTARPGPSRDSSCPARPAPDEASRSGQIRA